jgi:hypothetical protein
MRPTKGSPTVVIVTSAPYTVGKVAVLASGPSLEVTSFCHGPGAPPLLDSSCING